MATHEIAVNDAVEFATRATIFDKEHEFTAAIYYYKAAVQSLNFAILEGSQVAGLSEKAQEYINRIEELQKIKNETVKKKVQKNEQQLQLERAEFLLVQGLDADEANNTVEAIELYTQAVELCLKARKLATDKSLKEKLAKVAGHALDRAEVLKGKDASTCSSSVRIDSSQSVPSNTTKTQLIKNSGESRSPTLHVQGSEHYSPEEIGVLRVGSMINGREYVPFMSCDFNERFAYPLPFEDRDGKLVLSPKQKPLFRKWVRPESLSASPKIIEVIDCFSLRQTVVSDCSFVASLAVSALYEKRFRKRIISSIIYPQNRNGDPVYNPCGKYMIKLNLNGIQRKVIIDDYLPLDSHGELLCSYSSNRNEFWISLLEKAYMKVMGGYDFPGSNSNIDLHALTGWIPERIAMDVPSFNKDHTFKMLLTHHRKGDVLLTLATGEIPEAEAERAGLVPSHAYAVLDIQQVMGHSLLLLKNPWSHLRWKGKFSECDTKSWTSELQEALKYDPRNAQIFDNGVFWIDYKSVCHFFNVVYLNWDPKMFKYTYCIHQSWKAGCGPARDLYNIGENPQFSLELKATNAAVWILLTRHITERDDFAENKEYIAVLVYKNNGRRIYYPYEPEPYIDGVRINSPHYLCKIVVPENGATNYTLVISQYEKTSTIYYTLRAYATCPFRLTKVPNFWKFKHEVKNGEWNEATAGGCANHPLTYHKNPVYQLTLQSSSDDNHLLIDLKGPKQYQVGFDIVTVSTNNPNCSSSFDSKSSGPFRSGFCIFELSHVPSGTYNVIPSTFLPGQKSPFFLTFKSSCPISVKRIK